MDDVQCAEMAKKKSRSNSPIKIQRPSELPSLQMKHIIYGFVGAFYWSPWFRLWIKYTWALVNFLIIVVGVLFGSVGYFLYSTAHKPIGHIFYAIHLMNTIFLLIFTIPSFTYFMKNKIEDILTLSEETFFANALKSSKEIQQTEINIKTQMILQIVCISGCIIVHPFCLYFSGNVELINHLEYYVFPHMWLGRLQTASQYYTISIIQLLAAEALMMNYSAFSVYVYTLGNTYYEAFLGIKCFIKDLSAVTNAKFEKLLKEELPNEILSKDKLKNDRHKYYNTEREIQRQKLLSGIIVAAKAHQLLHKKMTGIKPQIEILFSAMLIFLVGEQCFLIYIISLPTVGLYMKTKCALMIWPMFLTLYTYCSAGKLMSDAEETLSMHVNNMPWYNLTPQQRKTYYIFLCQTQRRIQFYAVGVHEMSMPKLLQCLKLGYSLFNFLHRVANK